MTQRKNPHFIDNYLVVCSSFTPFTTVFSQFNYMSKILFPSVVDIIFSILCELEWLRVSFYQTTNFNLRKSESIWV